MSEEWPSPPRPERPALPRIEDLPLSAEGYDPAHVQEAFDAFYRHLAQLDSTLRAVEAVELFRLQAGELRADLRSIRAAGWSPYPRGYSVAPTPSLSLGMSDAVPRIALEVVFLVVVAVVVAVARFSVLEIVLVMLLAFALTALVEWIATRDRRQNPSRARCPRRCRPPRCSSCRRARSSSRRGTTKAKARASAGPRSRSRRGPRR